MSEWINTADNMPEENEKVLIQLPTSKSYAVAAYASGAFCDGLLRHYDIEWWQKIETPPHAFKPGDEVTIGYSKTHIGVVIGLTSYGHKYEFYYVYSVKLRRILEIESKSLTVTGVTYKDFADMINALDERQKQLCSK